VGLSTFDEVQPIVNGVTILNADGTAPKSITTAQTSRIRVDSILVSNTDTIAHVVRLYALISAVAYLIGSVSVPAGQGTAGTPAIDLLASALPITQVGIALAASVTLQASVEVVMTGATVLTINVVGGYV